MEKKVAGTTRDVVEANFRLCGVHNLRLIRVIVTVT
ncbi:unnamed protein product [Brassica rapa subsp. trilocularis]